MKLRAPRAETRREGRAGAIDGEEARCLHTPVVSTTRTVSNERRRLDARDGSVFGRGFFEARSESDAVE